jgi:hypothetical protein
MSKTRTITIVTASIVALFIAGLVVVANIPVEGPQPPTITRQDQSVVAIMQHLGLNYSQLNLVAGADPYSPSAYCSL